MAAGLNTGFVARTFVHTSAFAIAIRSASLATLAEIFGDVGMMDSLCASRFWCRGKLAKEGRQCQSKLAGDADTISVTLCLTPPRP